MSNAPIFKRQMEQIRVDAIDILAGRRPCLDDDVKRMAESMKAVGLRTPITVRYFPDRRGDDGTDDSWVLVAGAHRLAAAKSLGWSKIDCFEANLDDVGAEMWEIAENLHRAELTVLQRDEQIARWIELSDQKLQSGQVVPNESKRPDRRGHRREGGVRAAARDLGLNRKDAERAVKVAGLAPEAKDAARAAGLDGNRSALLRVARELTVEAQVAGVDKIVKAKAKPRPPILPDPSPRQSRQQVICDEVRVAIRALAGLPAAHEVRQWFAGSDGAYLVTETIGTARAWLNELADGWGDDSEETAT